MGLEGPDCPRVQEASSCRSDVECCGNRIKDDFKLASKYGYRGKFPLVNRGLWLWCRGAQWTCTGGGGSGAMQAGLSGAYLA
jgi:hypothetical protein